MEKPIQVLPILKESLNLYRDNFQLFFTVTLAGYAVFLLEHLLLIYDINIGILRLLTFIIGFLVLFWSTAALTQAVSKRYQGLEIDFKAAFQDTKDKLWRLIGISILQSLIITTGLLLLVIPGLYWAALFSLAGIVLILEDTGLFESFKRSQNLIQLHFWPVFGIYLLLFLINSLPQVYLYGLPLSISSKTLLVYFLSLLLTPWGMSVSVNIYNRLKQTQPEIELSADQAPRKGSGCLGCLTMILLSAVIVVLCIFWFINLNRFIRTEKGRAVFEQVAKRISPPMKFPDGITLNRPEGYLVVGAQDKATGYGLLGFVKDELLMPHIDFVSYNQLGIAEIDSLRFGQGQVWERYYDFITEAAPLNATRFKYLEKDSLKTVDIAGQSWVEYIWKSKSVDVAKRQQFCVYHYTLSDSGVIFAASGYYLTAEQTGKETLPPQLKEVREILAGFNF